MAPPCAPFLFLAQQHSMTPSETLKVCTWGLAPSQAPPKQASEPPSRRPPWPIFGLSWPILGGMSHLFLRSRNQTPSPGPGRHLQASGSRQYCCCCSLFPFCILHSAFVLHCSRRCPFYPYREKRCGWLFLPCGLFLDRILTCSFVSIPPNSKPEAPLASPDR